MHIKYIIWLFCVLDVACLPGGPRDGLSGRQQHPPPGGLQDGLSGRSHNQQTGGPQDGLPVAYDYDYYPLMDIEDFPHWKMVSLLRRYDKLKQCPDINPNPGPGPGRPSVKALINFNNPLESCESIKEMCKNPELKANVNIFAKALLEISGETECASTQTNDMTDVVCDLPKSMISGDISYIICNLWSQIDGDDQVRIIFMFFNHLQYEEQCDVFSFLGDALNQEIYEESLKSERKTEDVTLFDLKAASKEEFYEKCEKRLKCFVDALTNKKRSENDNLNFKSNVIENICKARNSKFVSEVGLKEHMVSYLASGKSRHSSQVFSKQGGKGTRPLLEKILKTSEHICKFSPPEKTSLFFSFDNIQKLLKSYRIGGNNQTKPLGIVVCSIMCLLPDGENKECDIQFSHENCPANWYTEYKYDKEKDIFVEKIDSNILKKCVKLDVSEEMILTELFENDLKDAIDFVSKDVYDDLQDSVDIQMRASIAKRRKLCTSGHINDNVKSNRTVCDRKQCKSKLKLENIAHVNLVEKEAVKEELNREELRAKRYLNVPCIVNEDSPKELAVGAIAVNPNTQERISKVLDEILEAAQIQNKFCVKLVLSVTCVTKVFNENKDFRKFIVVTSDGLPYKQMIDLIKHTHTCASCGKRLNYLADMRDHLKETHHSEYFQTYGNILPNIGHFHYCLTMLRSLVKLRWNIDYQELVKAIHFETPKALFCQEKVTDFRKSLDTNRTVRVATVRELVTPFVKYAKENDSETDVASYLAWKTSNVKCQTYESIFQIEKYFGTSFLLFHASLRANNFPLANIAKKMFSSLFHINRHPNYAIMDIQTHYVEEKLNEKVPELKKYLDLRRCSNFSGKPYGSEPHDERHEEFNKRGLNMQNVKTVEDFQQSFQLVDHFIQLKESCFEEYDIKMHGGNVITNQNYEENIAKMRVSMRKVSHLTKPNSEKVMLSMENKELNAQLPNIVKIAQTQRQENIMNVIRHDDFTSGYTNNVKFKVLKRDAEDRLGIDFETQLNILIASEEDAELRENLSNYCKASRLKPDFDEERMVDDILSGNFSFL